MGERTCLWSHSESLNSVSLVFSWIVGVLSGCVYGVEAVCVCRSIHTAFSSTALLNLKIRLGLKGEFLVNMDRNVRAGVVCFVLFVL